MPLPLQQHPFFGDALRLMGRNVQQLPNDAGAPILAVRLWGQLFTSRGPIWAADSSPLAKVEALQNARLRLLNADGCDAVTLRQAGFLQVMTASYVGQLDLSRSAITRQAAMHGKWRNAWRRGCDAPLTMTDTPFQRAKHQWLLDADLAQQRAKRFRALPHQLILAYAKARPKMVRVLIARHKGTPVAGMLFLLHHPVVTYQIGWSDAVGRRMRAHHRMLIHASDSFAGQGFTRFDLGTIDTQNAAGLARFKIGSGADIRQLGGTWLRLP